MFRVLLLLQACLLLHVLVYADDVYLKSGFVYRNVSVLDTTGNMLQVASEKNTFSLSLDAVTRIEKHEVIPGSKVVYEMYSEELYREFQRQQQESAKRKETTNAVETEALPTKHVNLSVGIGWQLFPDGGYQTTRVKLWYQSGIHVFAVRYVRGGSTHSGISSGIDLYQAGPTPAQRFTDIALMYGIGTELSGVSGNVTVGISSVRGTYGWTYLGMSPHSPGWGDFSGFPQLPIYDPMVFSTIGFPVEAEVASNGWFRYFGGSFSFFADFNSKASFDGILFSLQTSFPLQ